MTEILAAGGVVWRAAPSGDGLEIAVIHGPKHDDWSLPKGKVDPGETLLEAAVREVWEETGRYVVVGVGLGVARQRHRPRVVSYAMDREVVSRFTWAMAPARA